MTNTHKFLGSVLLLLSCNISQAHSILSGQSSKNKSSSPRIVLFIVGEEFRQNQSTACIGGLYGLIMSSLSIGDVFEAHIAEQDGDLGINDPFYRAYYVYVFYILVFLLLLYVIAKRCRTSHDLRQRIVNNVKEITETSDLHALCNSTILNEYDRELLEKAIVIIEERIGDPELKASFLAQKVYMGRSTFFVKIKSITGQTPRCLIIDIRLAKSMTMLIEEKDMTIGDIAFKLGFSDPSYFIKVFKNKVGVTPHQFRINGFMKNDSDG